MSILNRETFQMAVDGWYQIAALGEFPHGQSGLIQVVDGAACRAMVNSFNEDAQQGRFAGLLIDFDHFSLDARAKSEAAGWIVGLEARGQTADGRPQTTDLGDDLTAKNAESAKNAGLWAKIRWSDVGEAAARGRPCRAGFGDPGECVAV